MDGVLCKTHTARNTVGVQEEPKSTSYDSSRGRRVFSLPLFLPLLTLN